MSKKNAPAPQPKSLRKGLLAGLIGGLAGVLAMAAAERLLPRQRVPRPGSARAGSSPTEPAPNPLSLEAMHWSFGAAIGAAYGAVAEYFPSATAQQGVAFGMALETLADEGTLPALGLLTGSASAAATETASKLTSHVVYGVTTETVRHFLRKRL
jgi:putative membrane protein